MSITIKVAALVKNKKDEVLLIQERYGENNEPKWNLIKGTFDNENETLADCIIREIKEEAGLRAKNPILIKIFHYGDAGSRKILFVFLVNKFVGKVSLAPIDKQKKRGEDISNFKWFSQKEIKKLSKRECIGSYVYLSFKDSNFSGKIKIEWI